MADDRKPDDKAFLTDFKRFFGRGLAILLPSVLTLWILYQLFMFVMNNVGEPINAGVRWAVIQVTPRVVDEANLPKWFQVVPDEVRRARAAREMRGIDEMDDAQVKAELRERKFSDWWDATPGLDLIGLVLAIVVIYFAGVLLGGYLGRQLYERLEAFMERVPGFKQVYPHVKRVVEMVVGDTPIAFNRVVIVQYPRVGIWTVGLVTSNSLRSIHAVAGTRVLTVFIPTTPTPFTGFTINLPESEVHDLPVTVEEAVRFFITGGVLVPDSQVPEGVKPEQAAASAAAKIRSAQSPNTAGAGEDPALPGTRTPAGTNKPV